MPEADPTPATDVIPNVEVLRVFTDQDLMRAYTHATMWVFNLHDFLNYAPDIDWLPAAQLRMSQDDIFKHRERHAELHAELVRRGIFG